VDRRDAGTGVFAYADNHLIDVRFGIIMDLEASRAIRQGFGSRRGMRRSRYSREERCGPNGRYRTMNCFDSNNGTISTATWELFDAQHWNLEGQILGTSLPLCNMVLDSLFWDQASAVHTSIAL
jgi:hypothetical protein